MLLWETVVASFRRYSTPLFVCFGVGDHVVFAATLARAGPGNHESANDFAQYIARFDHMPNSGGNSAFHSFNIGKAHIVMFSSEVMFYLSGHGLFLMPEQYAWLENDLASVNRTATPWIMTMAHRPMYCSPNDDQDDCHQFVSLVRDGIFGMYGLENLLYKYGVEMHIGAHEHSYEANYPVYNFTWNSTLSGEAAYTDFTRTVHLLVGNAGCPEDQDAWQAAGNPFSRIRVNDYGWATLQVLNETHVFWQSFSSSAGGQVVDSMYFIKHSHGPFGTDAADAAAAEAEEDESATAETSARNALRGHNGKHAHKHRLGRTHAAAQSGKGKRTGLTRSYMGTEGELPADVVMALAKHSRKAHMEAHTHASHADKQ